MLARTTPLPVVAPTGTAPSPRPTQAAAAPTAVAAGPTATPTATVVPPTPETPGSPAPTRVQGRPPGAIVGVQIHLHNEDLPGLLGHLETLAVDWVKVQVSWKLYQPGPDRYDQDLFEELDALVREADARNIAVLLGVAKAPEWSRLTTEMDGPPADFARFEAFMRTLATRYQGQIGAYELWNEPNLRREWNGAPLDPAAAVNLMRAGAAGVRSVENRPVLISGAPAPTGIDNGVDAIDDRRFLAEMLAAGLLDVVDAVGVHPYGWANPPGATVGDPDPAVSSHADHRSFYFLDTLREYRALVDGVAAPGPALWVTEFGWGTFDDLGGVPPPGAEFMSDVSLDQQARYLRDALRLAATDVDIGGPLVVWNLNFAPTFGAAFAESGYSLLGLDGAPRPAYDALRPVGP